MALTLIIGGARSGKSALAVARAASSGARVHFIATMAPGDDELRARVESHRAERPPAWRTIEAPRDLIAALESVPPSDFVVIDCLTLWVSNSLVATFGDGDSIEPSAAARAIDDLRTEARAVAELAEAREGETCVVTNEVGAGVVPAYALGRVYRDALGVVNMIFARRANSLLTVTAGYALDIKAMGATAVPAPDAGASG